MATTATKPIALTPAELNLLGAMLGAPVLAGVPDPFFGLLADEIEAALAEAQASLIARGLLQLQDEGPPIVHLSVALMVGALCFPQASLCLAAIEAGQAPQVTWFHLTRNLAISVTAEGAPPVCLLQAYPGPEAVLAAVLARLMPAAGTIPPGFRASLEIAGRRGAALQVGAVEGLLTEAPAGIQRTAATAEAVERAAWSLIEAAWPGKEGEA
jgi:hypothetical protein